MAVKTTEYTYYDATKALGVSIGDFVQTRNGLHSVAEAAANVGVLCNAYFCEEKRFKVEIFQCVTLVSHSVMLITDIKYLIHPMFADTGIAKNAEVEVLEEELVVGEIKVESSGKKMRVETTYHTLYSDGAELYSDIAAGNGANAVGNGVGIVFQLAKIAMESGSALILLGEFGFQTCAVAAATIGVPPIIYGAVVVMMVCFIVQSTMRVIEATSNDALLPEILMIAGSVAEIGGMLYPMGMIQYEAVSLVGEVVSSICFMGSDLSRGYNGILGEASSAGV